MCVLIKYYAIIAFGAVFLNGMVPSHATQCWVCTSFLDAKCSDGSFEANSSKSVIKQECLLTEKDLKDPNLYSTKFYCFKSVFKGHSKARTEIQEHLSDYLSPQLHGSDLGSLYNETDVVARGCILASPKDPETTTIKGRKERYNRCRPYSEGGNYAEICVCDGDYCNMSNNLKFSILVPFTIIFMGVLA